MQNNSTQEASVESHCRYRHHLYIKSCNDNDDKFYYVIYYVSIVLAAVLAITAGGLWLKRRFYIKPSQKVAFLDGYLLWQMLHASIRIISDITLLFMPIIKQQYMVLELVYDIPFYCDQVSVILFILGILLAIPRTRPFPTTPGSQRPFQIFIPSHNSIIWFFRIFSFIIFPSLAVFALLTGYFHSAKLSSSHHLETQMIRAHNVVYAVSCVSLAICFAYFGRKVKRFAEGSIGLLMDIEMDSTRYGRLRLMRRSITRINTVNGLLCAKYLLFTFVAVLQLELVLSVWISKLVAVLITTLPLASMILCTLLIHYGDTNPEKAFGTYFSQMSHSQHTFLTRSFMEPSNQHDKNEFNLLPPPLSYKDDDTDQQYPFVQETERKQQNNMNRHSSATTISTNYRSSHIRNSATILPDIIVSSPPEIVLEKRASRVVGKSKFVAAWLMDQHERTSTKEISPDSSW